LIIALIGIAAIAAFLFGIHSGHNKTLPFRILAAIRQRTRSAATSGIPEISAPRFCIDIESEPALRRQRSKLIEYIWGQTSLPIDRFPDEVTSGNAAQRYDQFKDHTDIAEWLVRMQFGIDSKILVLVPKGTPRKTAVVYQQGHEGDVSHGAGVISRLSKEGFYVVALSMPLLGPNSQPEVEFRRHGRVRLRDHDFFPLVDFEYGVHSVRFFLEPVIACVNRLIAQGYTSIAMLGYSGGGWTTTMCAAIDDRITFSSPIAASLPFSLRNAREMSDYENHIPELYSIANYPELHVLGAHGQRFQLQILNEFDPVAWSGRRGELYEQAVRDTLARLGGGGRFEVMTDSSWAGHGISKSALRRILAELPA
jgi:dienelactone hydrolase